jgi:hypothetical protein
MLGNSVTVWEDDPASGTVTTAAKPDVTKQPFGYLFHTPEPPLSADPYSPEFRYWTAAEALRRGADFWAPTVLAQQWQRGTVLEVYLDRADDLQADYDRISLSFYHGDSAALNETVYTGASPDTLCHELGHAILDAIKPALWSADVTEIAAFHESFGDMSAILSALQLPSLRASILTGTAGQLYSNSRLSRLAEQFGVALHAEDVCAADADCLRNAWNTFQYCNYVGLQPKKITTELSADPHSFSRIFTGALFEVLGKILTEHAADGNAPTSGDLLDVSEQMRDIIAGGVVLSSVVTEYFAEVAFRMVQASAMIDPAYPAIFLEVFVNRLILSNETVAAIQALQTVSDTFDDVSEEDDQQSEPVIVSVSVAQYGLDEPLLVQVGTGKSGFIARSATSDGQSVEPISPERAAAVFVAQLFANGQVDRDEQHERSTNVSRSSNRTHNIVREGAGLMLRRRLFCCGSPDGACRHMPGKARL